FVVETYWTLNVDYAEGFRAFVPADGKDDEDAAASAERGTGNEGREATVDSDGDGDVPTLVPHSSLRPAEGGRLRPKRFASAADAEATRNVARSHPHVVRDVQRRRTEKRPEPPYTTSTMQQDASRKLRLSARQAADQAQALFEAGYVTYHRTDSTRVSDDAVAMARAHIAQVAPDALPKQPPRARGKAGAQDAHEAIRPTKLSGDDAPPPGTDRLYAMIKARFLASQCKPAVFDRTTVWVDSGPVAWAAQGAVLVDPGFLHFWRPYSRQEDEELPAVAPGQTLNVADYAIEEKQTTPPTRYDTGALIRKLEVSGIGRPATFASIIETLLKRGYVHELKAGKGKVFLQPTPFGLQVDGLLTEAFPELVSEGYTAAMESELDRIEHSAGESRVGYLTRWYAEFREAIKRALPRASAYRVAHKLNAMPRAGAGGGARGEETTTRCDRCGEACYRKIARKKGKGSFLACPACNMMRDVRARTRPAACPKCGSTLIERRGRKKGVKFFGCVRYRADERPCDYVEWEDRRSAEHEPRGERAASVEREGTRSPDRDALSTLGAPRSPSRRPKAAAPPSTSAPTDKPCPRCGASTLAIVTPADGAAPYYACAGDAGGCGFTLTVGARRRGAPCPKCGGVVLERRTPSRAGGGATAGPPGVWACAKAPGCDYQAALTR
ncbi:MAG: DNA topoisomerase, partial [Gemmatimonadaceae bacterium]